jgi:hypothetical protein
MEVPLKPFEIAQLEYVSLIFYGILRADAIIRYCSDTVHWPQYKL